MNKALLTRNLFLLKKNYLKYIALLFLVPMFLYIANVLFFSNYLDGLIKDWACIGVWVSSSILCSYIYMYDIMSGIRSESNKFNFIVISPAPILNILLDLSLIKLHRIAFKNVGELCTRIKHTYQDYWYQNSTSAILSFPYSILTILNFLLQLPCHLIQNCILNIHFLLY